MSRPSTFGDRARRSSSRAAGVSIASGPIVWTNCWPLRQFAECQRTGPTPVTLPSDHLHACAVHASTATPPDRSAPRAPPPRLCEAAEPSSASCGCRTCPCRKAPDPCRPSPCGCVSTGTCSSSATAWRERRPDVLPHFGLAGEDRHCAVFADVQPGARSPAACARRDARAGRIPARRRRRRTTPRCRHRRAVKKSRRREFAAS